MTTSVIPGKKSAPLQKSGPVYARADEAGGGSGPQVGVVTSSTLGPMLGSVPIAFARIKTSHAEPGTTVLVSAEGEHVEAAVGGLCFHPGETS